MDRLETSDDILGLPRYIDLHSSMDRLETHNNKQY